MKLPKLEEYLQALQQAPAQLFSDAELRQGRIEVNALGMPRTRSGNFALVFRIFSQQTGYAVRCFTRMAQESELRQREISKALSGISRTLGANSPFVTFELQPSGIRVAGIWFPVVKMAWCEGITLGEFVSQNYQSPRLMGSLRASLAELSKTLARYEIAHGDIQPSNILVAQDGRRLRLIDYDGCFVPALRGLPACELGHINFQHPKRDETHFDHRLDRFSFQLLDVALQLLEREPSLWEKTYSDEEGFIFRAHDLADPRASQAFLLASRVAGMAGACQDLAKACMGAYETVVAPMASAPSAPIAEVTFSPPAQTHQAKLQTAQALQQIYLSSHPVVNATHFQQLSHLVAQRIELIGKVVEVRSGKKSFGGRPALRPYVYIDFSPISGGRVVRAKILPEVLEGQHFTQQSLPNDRWVGKWVSINEVVQPLSSVPHPAFPGGVSELSVHVEHPSQLRLIPEEEARFRLAGNHKKSIQRSMTRSVSNEVPESMAPKPLAAPLAAPPAAPSAARPAAPAATPAQAPARPNPASPPPNADTASTARKNRNASILERIRNSL